MNVIKSLKIKFLNQIYTPRTAAVWSSKWVKLS